MPLSATRIQETNHPRATKTGNRAPQFSIVQNLTVTVPTLKSSSTTAVEPIEVVPSAMIAGLMDVGMTL
jgi:hypothetical protein